MEAKDQSLAEDLFDSNPRFRMLYEEHLLLERELRDLDEKDFLTSEEAVARKKVQKLKLAGKDEMERILRTCRQ